MQISPNYSKINGYLELHLSAKLPRDWKTVVYLRFVDQEDFSRISTRSEQI